MPTSDEHSFFVADEAVSDETDQTVSAATGGRIRAREVPAPMLSEDVPADLVGDAVDVLRNDLCDLLRGYESVPYGDLRLNAERAVAKVLTAIAEHPVLEIRPYYPTQDAYDAACRALEKHRQRADQAEASIARVHDVHYPITRDGNQWCNECSSITGHHYMPYPCPTIRALDEPAQQGDTDGG